MAALALRTDGSDIQHALHGLALAAGNVDTRIFEVAPPARVRAELVPALRRVLADTIMVLDDVLVRYDAPSVVDAPADSGVFNCLFDDMVVDSRLTSPSQRIADISFMARWELERKQAAMAEAVEGGDDRLIAECCSARRRVVKATSGVERVLSEVENRPSVFVSLFQTERQRALETRSAYCTLALGASEAATVWQDLDLQRCLRSIGTRIAQLVGRPIYEELRIEDRRPLRSLQARLVDWLRGPRDALEGRRLVSEIVAFTSLLMEVNQRPVLIQHDCEVLDRLLASLGRAGRPAEVFPAWLVPLRGREPELDALIDREADLCPELWHDIARRTHARLREQVAHA